MVFASFLISNCNGRKDERRRSRFMIQILHGYGLSDQYDRLRQIMKPFGNAAMTGCSSQKRRVPPQTAILHVYALLPEASC